MTQVLIPLSRIESGLMYLIIAFEAFYGLETDVGPLDEVSYFIINVNPTLGKAAAIKFAKGLGLESVLFMKNSVLFKKYCDTGIVERLGEVILENNVYKLTGV